MAIKIFNRIKGDRIYFAIVFFILLLIVFSGILTPLLVRKLQNNWQSKLSTKISNIQSSVTLILNSKENKLLDCDQKLRDKLRKVLNPQNSSYGALTKVVNSGEFEKYSIEVLAPNGRLIAWNENVAIKQNDILPLTFPAGQCHFYIGDLITYFTVTDTVLTDNDLFYFVVSIPVEKQYTLQNPYYTRISFTNEISDKFHTQFEVGYSPFAESTKDGRKYSFDLVNKQGNKIGNVAFEKPAIDTAVNSVYDTTGELQSILIILAFIFTGFGFRNEFKTLKHRTTKILVFTFYCIVFRLLLYYVDFPSNILNGPLTNPAYFSSTFGNGIVKSPVEFFLTSLFALIICIKGFLYLVNYIHLSPIHKQRRKIFFVILLIPMTILFLITVRGFCASVKSIIFDSTLRYFKEPNLIPNLPSMLMNLNLLMIGTAIILLLISYILLLASLVHQEDKKRMNLIFAGLFLLFQVFGFLFIEFQSDPLITPVMMSIFILLVFWIALIIYGDKLKNVYNFVYITLAASVISITLLNYFNLKLEIASLKTTAFEINRPNNNLLQFLLRETLQNVTHDDEVLSYYYDRNSNYYAESFKLWANSSLQRESLNSSLSIWDKDRNYLGGFNSGISPETKMIKEFSNYSDLQPEIIQSFDPNDSTKKIFTGIVKITDRGFTLGYITASIGFDLQDLSTNAIPNFIESKKNIINPVIDVSRLKIFEFSDSKLTHVYGNIYPSRDQIMPILNASFNQDNEAWITLQLSNENFYAYLLKNTSDYSHNITAVLTREKRLSWDLFNFFKIFLIQSIFIIILFLVLFAFKIKHLKLSFRAQLLTAFIIISLIPIVVLAIYNRQTVQQRTQTAIENELSERLNYIENIIREELAEIPSHDFVEAFNNAGQDLGVSFAVFEGNTQIYNSRGQYYKSGLFSDKLNPEAYYQLNYQSYREYFDQEKIDNFDFDSFYKKITIDGTPLIISVNDAFNKVRLSYSVTDIDVFIFGIFTFTTIIMVLLSAFLANRISSPIRRLTKATTSVANGDFNIELEDNMKGEIKELYTGFNLMTRELQKNQIELAELERENAWKEMAKQVAHEIKNPLTPMKLAVQQLIVSYRDKNKNFDSIFEKISSTILSQIENLSQIASEFSRFARMPNFKIEIIDMLPVINDSLNLFVHENIKMQLKTNLTEAIVEADRSQIRRMLINLIRNSIQAGADLIKLRLEQEDSSFVIILSDNGSGIPQNIKEKIFDSNFTTKIKGMGLGLTLAKRFLEGINGSISLADDVSSGASFRIYIPRYNKD